MAKDEFWKADAPAADEGEFWKADRNAAQADLPAGVAPSNAGAGRGSINPARVTQPAEPATFGQTGASGSVLEGRQLFEPETFDFRTASQARRSLDDGAERVQEHGSIAPIVGPKATAGTIAKGVASDVVASGKGFRAGINQMAADLTGNEHFADQARRERGQVDLMTAVNTPEFESDTARGIYSGVSSMVRQAPSLAAAILTKNPNLALTGMVAPMVPDEYGKFRQRGATPGEALPAALGMAATEYLTEKMPMGVLVNKFGKTGAAQFMGELLAKEIPGEQVATVVQDAIDTATANPDKTWGDYWAERPGAAYQTLLATLTQTGIMGGASAGARKLDQHLQERDLAQAIREDAATVLLPVDRTPQIKALRDAGDTTAAELLQRRQDRETSQYKADQETRALADFGPEIQQHYKTIRVNGMQPGDAVTHTAARFTFDQAAQLANLSPKAAEATLKVLDTLPAEKVPAFVEKAIKNLTDRGLAQPFDGIDTIASTIDAQRERLLDAVLAGEIRPTMDTVETLEAQQDAAQEPTPAAPEAQTGSTSTGYEAKQFEPVSDAMVIGAKSQSNSPQGLTAFEQVDGGINVPLDVSSSANLDAANSEGAVDRSNRNAKALGNFSGFHPALGKGFGQLDVPTQRQVLNGVLTSGEDQEIVRSIVQTIPVNVMNDLVGEQLSSDFRLGDVSMLINAATADHNFLVGGGHGGASESGSAASVAENSGVDMGGFPPNYGPAIRTGKTNVGQGDSLMVGNDDATPKRDIQFAAANVQDAPQGTDVAFSNEGDIPVTQAQADQAPQAVGSQSTGPVAGVPDEGSGYAVEAAGVIPPTAQQQQANDAGRRMRAAAWEANPLRAFLGEHGIHSSLVNEFAPGKAERRKAMVPGYGPIFRKFGKNLDMLTEAAREAGFIQTEDTAELHDLIAKVFRGERVAPLYADGVADNEMERAMQARYEDFVEQARAEQEDDPFGPLQDAGYTESDLASTDYADASPELLAEVAALREQMEAAGLDVDSLLERLALQYPDLTEDQFNERLQDAYRQAIAEGAQPRGLQAAGSVDAGQAPQIGTTESQRTGPTGSEVTSELRPDGTLAVMGDKQALRERLIAAGIPSKSILPSSTGVVVGRTQAKKAQEALAGPVLKAPTQGEVLANQNRAAQADKLDERAQIKRESEAGAGLFQLQTQDGRQDTTGNLFDAAQNAEIPEQNTPSAGQKSEKTKQTAAITDFGEKIGGAKKDLWTGFSDELGAVSDDDIANHPLSKVWPAPDYQALIDGGASPEVVAFVRAARDEVPAKPRKGYKVRGWAEKVRTLRGFAMDLMAGKLTMADVRGQLEKSGSLSRSMQGFLGRVDLYQAVGHAKSLEGIQFGWHHFTMYRGQENVSMWVVEKDAAASTFSNWPSEIATGKTKEEAIEAFRKAYDKLGSDKEAKKGVQFDIISFRGQTGYWIAKKLGRNHVKVHGPLATVQEARAYRDNNQAELVAKLEKVKEIPAERRDVNEPRVGEDMRNGADVTPEFFSDTFGFRGVEFGNWVEQGRRQQDLNNAFDALMDMAGVLGLPPKAMSLNGQLALAFGARGGGGAGIIAAAHYEPDKVVINLTKKNGAGSLGHEWWHAVDNYFAKMRKGDFMTTALDVRLASRDAKFVPYEGVRQEMVMAFGNVVKSINLTNMKTRSAVLDGKRSKDYWTTGEELSARAFEAYLIAKLQDQNASNDYLANILSEDAWNAAAALGLENENSYPYPIAKEVPGIRAAFDQFFQTVQTKETEKGVAIYSTSDRSVPLTPSHWIDVGVIAKEVENRIGQFAHQPPVRIRDSAVGVMPGATEADAVAGAVHDGAIYLFRDQLATVTEVQRTLFHELLHYGLRKIYSRGEFIQEMRKLYERDAWIKERADAWAKSEHGRKAADFGGEEYATARGVDETLAILAEPNAGIYTRTDLASRVVVRVSRWLADLAQAWGFKNFAAKLRGMKNPEARELILQVFRRLETDANPEHAGWFDDAEPAFKQSGEGKDQTETPAFKRWFGDWQDPFAFSSKRAKDKPPISMAMADGRPMVLYHATNSDFNAFEVARSTTNSTTFGDFDTERYGVFTTPDVTFAEEYFRGRDGANIVPVYMSVKSPVDLTEGISGDVISDIVGNSSLNRRDFYDVPTTDLWQLFDGDFGRQVVDALKKAGYDGAIMKELSRDRNREVEVWVAFDNTQLKSALGNNGQFDPKDADIRHSRPMDADMLKRMFTPMAPLNVSETQMAVADMVKGWKNGPRLRVVASPSELPGNAPSDARGQYQGDTVWLVAGAHRSAGNVQRTLAHEAIAHYGLREMLGGIEHERAMRNIQQGIQRGDKALLELRDQVRMAYRDEAGNFNLTPEQEADEIAARAVEVGFDAKAGEFRPGFEWIKRVYARIAQFLRNLGLNVTFTHAELQGMLAQAQQFLTKPARGEAMVVGAPGAAAMAREGGNSQLLKWLGMDHAGVERDASTFDEARQAAKAFQGKPLTNQKTGMVAQVSRNNLDKMLSTKAVHKSETPQSHSLAVANLDQLFERAAFGWSKSDRDADPSITAIHRLFAPVFHNGRAQLVKLTVKETARADQPNPLYTVESVELNEKSPAAQWVDSTVQADRLDPTSIRSAGEVHSLAQRIEDFNNRLDGKQIITASKQSLQALREKLGDIEPDFQAATGYGFDALTESEARYLANFKPTQSVRDRILAEGRQGRERANQQAADGLNDGPAYARGPQDPELPGIDQDQPGKPTPPVETRARATQRVVQDQFNRFTVIRNWAKEQGVNLSQLSDVWGFEERMHGRIATRIEDFREQRVAPLVKKIQAAGFTMDQVAEFLHAQHAAERNSQIEKIDPSVTNGSGMSTAKANAILAKSTPELAALANEFRAITDDTRQILLRAGIITSEMADAWTKAYKHYVPLKGGDEDTTPTGTGKGLSVKATNKRAMGHGARQEHIIENIMRDHERAVMLAEKNRVGHSLLAMVVELGRDDIATFGQPEQRKVLKQSTQYEVVGRNGAVLGTFDSIGSANRFIVTQQRDGLTVRPVKGDAMVAYMASPMLADNEVQVYIKGHTLRIQLNDPLLARAYKRLGVEHLNKLLAVNREINNFLSKAYTGFNPEFFFKNVMRDFTAGLINITGREGGSIAAKAMANYPKAFAQMLRYSFTNGKSVSPMIAEYRKHGGSTGAAYLGDIERIGADIKAAYEDYQGVMALAKDRKYLPAARSATRKLVRLITGWMEHLNAAGENAMRVAVFEAIRKTPGRTAEEAASAAKNATVNFNRKGEIGAQMGAMYLFFNAGMQGSAATLGALTTGKHQHQAQVLAGSLALLAYTMAAMQFGGDDDEWERIPGNVKDRNLVIRVGAETYVTLAVPYGYGYFFTLGNALFDLQRGADKDHVALNLASGLLEHFGPAINPLNGDEADAKGLIELMPGAVGGELMRASGRLLVNRNGMGSEIVPDSNFDDGKPDSLRMQRRTTGSVYDTTASTLNQITGGTKSQPGMVDVSPETLRFWTETVTGGAGKFVLDSANLASMLAAQSTETDPEKRAALMPEIREIPIVRTVVRKADVRDSRRLYWDGVTKVKSAQQDLRRAEKMEDLAGLEKVAEERGAWVGLAKAIEGTNSSVKAFREAVADINASEEYTKAEKRWLIKDLEKGEAEIYEGMNQLFSETAKISK